MRQTRSKLIAALLTTLGLAPSLSRAHDDHEHGGAVAMTKEYHFEVVFAKDGLKVHCRYRRMVNFCEGWHGHLWRGRFASFALDVPYLLTADRYVEPNPARG